LRYAENSWPVLPVNGKVPLAGRGVLDASADAGQVKEWWSRWPSANIGYAIRPEHVVVDLDSPGAVHALSAEGFELPATASVETGRGRHFYYLAESAVSNRVGVVAGVDLKASGGYVVVPPSVHASGKVYQWLTPPRDMAPAPDWIYQAASMGGGTGDLRDLLAEPVPEGQRNHILARWAGCCVRYLPGRLAVEAVRWLNREHFQPPLSDREVNNTLFSIMRRELRRRGEAA